MAIARSDMFGGTYDPRIQDYYWDREQEEYFRQLKQLASEKAYIRTEPISESQVKAVLPVKSSLLLLCEDI